MDHRYCCRECLRRQPEDQTCAGCGGDDIVDGFDESQRRHFVEELRTRAGRRRKRFVFAMEALAIVLCAGFLFVSLTIASGLGGGALSWVAKLAVVALLAGIWWAIPQIYDHYFRGPASQLVLEWRDGH